MYKEWTYLFSAVIHMSSLSADQDRKNIMFNIIMSHAVAYTHTGGGGCSNMFPLVFFYYPYIMYKYIKMNTNKNIF